MKKLTLLLVFLVLAFSVFAQIEAKKLSPCSSGSLTTSVHKRFQMSYTKEDFIQIKDIDLEF